MDESIKKNKNSPDNDQEFIFGLGLVFFATSSPLSWR